MPRSALLDFGRTFTAFKTASVLGTSMHFHQDNAKPLSSKRDGQKREEMMGTGLACPQSCSVPSIKCAENCKTKMANTPVHLTTCLEEWDEITFGGLAACPGLCNLNSEMPYKS